MAVPVSAIYFKAEWVTKFGSYGNITFHTPSGDVKAPFMEAAWHTAGYREGEGYKAVILPHKNTSIATPIIVPEDTSWLTTKYSEMVTEALNHFKEESIYEGSVKILMCRFEIRFGEDNPRDHTVPPGSGHTRRIRPREGELQRDDARRRLRRACPPRPSLGRKNGTGAGVATAVVVYLTAVPLADADTVIDRPFLYMLWYRDSEAILSSGT